MDYGRLRFYIGAKAKASLNKAILSSFIDPKPGDLTMTRMKPE